MTSEYELADLNNLTTEELELAADALYSYADRLDDDLSNSDWYGRPGSEEHCFASSRARQFWAACNRFRNAVAQRRQAETNANG
jgi:hypothetical protein